MRGGWILAGGLAGSALLGCAALAQDIVTTGHATSIAREQQALRDANGQGREARARALRLDAQAKRATAQADRARAQAAALAARIQESEAAIRAGQARIFIINRLTAQQAARLATQQGPIVRLTAALQSLARRPPVLALLQPGSMSDAVHMRSVLAVTLPEIERRTAGLRAELARSRQLRAMAVQANDALGASQRALASQQQQLRRIETERRLAARGLSSNATLETERAIALGEKARDIAELMDTLEDAGAVRDDLISLPGPELRPDRPGSTATPSGEVRVTNNRAPAYRLPLVGALVTGMGEMSDSGIRARGLTIAAQPGAQVVAPAGGHVAFAGFYRGFGQIVIIDHGQGWTSLVTNLGRLSVAAGQGVAQGDPIGTATTAVAPSVTVELRRQGRPVDIVAMLGAR
ncbi:murein hydrolase activator EnvC family protein [Sphingobium subterraneum]|nr:peptidoglycan DD-metalloendopeptidase family protein [Sphingobium subterraneum]